MSCAAISTHEVMNLVDHKLLARELGDFWIRTGVTLRSTFQADARREVVAIMAALLDQKLRLVTDEDAIPAEVCLGREGRFLNNASGVRLQGASTEAERLRRAIHDVDLILRALECQGLRVVSTAPQA